MYIGGSKAEGTSGPLWDFLNLTTWEQPAAMFELSVPPGRDGGTSQECPFLTSLQEISSLLRIRQGATATHLFIIQIQQKQM